LKISITVTAEVNEAAAQAWMYTFGVEPRDLRNDIKTYLGNGLAGTDFREIIGEAIPITWR
jgi:hypothetical protein